MQVRKESEKIKVSQVSEKYDTPVTPAGWAFAIWGPIFLLEVTHPQPCAPWPVHKDHDT